MLLDSHLKVARKVMRQCVGTDVLAERLFLLGSIAPDLNFFLPSHRIGLIDERFCRRLERASQSQNRYIKSFTCGLLMHYTCDFFCLAHNWQKIISGPRHSKYELGLSSYIRCHIAGEVTNVLDQEVTERIQSELAERRLDEVFQEIVRINNEYMATSVENTKENMNRDIEYAVSMCTCLLQGLLQPKLATTQE